MRNLLDLFEQLTDVMYELGINPRDVLDGVPTAEDAASAIRVVGAHQPQYPLAENISKLVLLPADEDDIEGFDETDLSGEQDMICWLVLGGHPHDLSPYAPHSCFDAK